MQNPASKITFRYLRGFNGAMAALHFIQAVLMLVMGLTITNIKDFKLPFTVSFLTYDTNMGRLVSDTNNIGNIPIGAMVSIFLFMSAIAHFLVVLPKINISYNRNLERGINYFRWFEYALSSSVMIVIIAMLFGVYDVGSIILIIGLNATMNLCGLMMEIHNQTTAKTNWTGFIVGSFAGVFPWIIILMYFLGGGNYSQIPWFVYAIFGSYFVFFNLFPINMVLQYKKVGKWKDYLYGERGYIILSLVAKTLLAWLVFAGTMQPQ
ncbi:MAG: heliorhodopsin HeR [Actinomycetota bacterium]|nr:heliorhodopsin HeR [Actinomycetota bacterium]